MPHSPVCERGGRLQTGNLFPGNANGAPQKTLRPDFERGDESNRRVVQKTGEWLKKDRIYKKTNSN